MPFGGLNPVTRLMNNTGISVTSYVIVYDKLLNVTAGVPGGCRFRQINAGVATISPSIEPGRALELQTEFGLGLIEAVLYIEYKRRVFGSRTNENRLLAFVGFMHISGDFPQFSHYGYYYVSIMIDGVRYQVTFSYDIYSYT